MLDSYIPGTSIPFDENDNSFNKVSQIIQVANGLFLNQVCHITNLQTSTIQNWVKRGYVPKPQNKKYYERHLARILLISSLRECMIIEDIGELMVLINGDVDDISDDIISEEKLYNLFCLTIKRLDPDNLNDSVIESTIETLLPDFEGKTKTKLIYSLKVMVYSYIAAKCRKNVDEYLNIIREI